MGASGLAAHLADFLESRRVRGYSQGDQRRAERVLTHLLGYLAPRGIKRPAAVTEADVVSFLRHVKGLLNRFGRPASDHQQRAWLTVVKAFFADLERRGVILASPASSLALPKTLRLPRRVLSESEARRLMAAPFAGSWVGKRDRGILELLYGTGIRFGECLRLDLTDLDLLEGRLLIRSGKGRKDRVVPIGGRAVSALDLYLRESRPELARETREGALFLSKYGRRLSPTRLHRLVVDHARFSGIGGHVHPHVLRHTCATHLLRGGADIREVQQLLGHSVIDTTAIYTRVEVSDLREVLRRSHPRERSR